LVVILAGAYLLVFGRSTSGTVDYDFGTVARGDIENTVSATGTVTTVEVGTQISGTIDSVYVDFNDHVKTGRLLAVLDTTLLKIAVLDAQSSLSRSEAELQQAQADYDRNKSLFDRRLLSGADFLTYQVNLRVQKAAVQSAEAALARAQRSLDLAVIRSPITGIVASRNIESGRTVATSLSSPTLFRIAEDLSRMEVLADVDESNIRYIRSGQETRFEVASYPDKKFSGTVKQIRLQPNTVSNVVTYTVVVEAANPEGLLLPGMTATIEFVTDRRADVLLVPNRAVRSNSKPDREEPDPARCSQSPR
jgi:HlyD family secretion protein